MTTKRKAFEAFRRGALEALAAHMIAWSTLASVERLSHLVGHFLVAIGARIAEEFFR